MIAAEGEEMCPHCGGIGRRRVNTEHRIRQTLQRLASLGRSRDAHLYRGNRTRLWYMSYSPRDEAPWLPLSEHEVRTMIGRGLLQQRYPDPEVGIDALDITDEGRSAAAA